MSMTYTRDSATDAEANSWAETRQFHPLDQQLRDRGFVIRHRPKHGPDKWERAGVLYTEAQALAIVYEEVTAAPESRSVRPRR